MIGYSVPPGDPETNRGLECYGPGGPEIQACDIVLHMGFLGSLTCGTLGGWDRSG